VATGAHQALAWVEAVVCAWVNMALLRVTYLRTVRSIPTNLTYPPPRPSVSSEEQTTMMYFI